MLNNQEAFKLKNEMKMQKVSDEDLEWILKQCGVDSVHQLTKQEADKIRMFAAERRKHGQHLVEQWDKFNASQQ